MKQNDHVRLSEEFSTGPHRTTLGGALVHEVWDVSNRGSFHITCDSVMPIFDDDAVVTDGPTTCLQCLRRRLR